MNDSLDLRNRILKMRESNNLTVPKEDALNNNLMSEFESSIKDNNKKETNSDQGIYIDKNKEIESNSIKKSLDIRGKTRLTPFNPNFCTNSSCLFILQ